MKKQPCQVLLRGWRSDAASRMMSHHTLGNSSMMRKSTRKKFQILDLNYLEIKRHFSITQCVNRSIEKLFESLPIESHKWFNTRTIVNVEQLKGKPTIFLSVDEFSSDVFQRIMTSE